MGGILGAGVIVAMFGAGRFATALAAESLACALCAAVNATRCSDKMQARMWSGTILLHHIIHTDLYEARGFKVEGMGRGLCLVRDPFTSWKPPFFYIYSGRCDSPLSDMGDNNVMFTPKQFECFRKIVLHVDG